MRKIRIFDLAQELRQKNIRIIIEDARRLGARADVPSNTISEAIADKIRTMYRANLASQKTEKVSASKARLLKASALNKDNKLIAEDVCKTAADKNISAANNGAAEIILESKKAIRISERGRCSKCLVITKPLWKYSKSNIDEVRLCSLCKQIVYARSFERIDALDVAEQGGLFERNRRKH